MDELIDLNEKYSHPDVIRYWEEFSLKGIRKSEDSMIKQYFPKKARVLDLGCAVGRVSLALSSPTRQVIGLDIVGKLLQAGNRLHDQLGISGYFTQGDMRLLPFESNGFDVVLIFMAGIQHIQERSARQQTFQEIARVLKPDGVLILEIDNLRTPLTIFGMQKIQVKAKKAVGQDDVDLQSQFHLSNFMNYSSAKKNIILRGLISAVKIVQSIRDGVMYGGNNLLKRFHIISGEPGDTNIDVVSASPTSGNIFFHKYSHSELLEDSSSAGFELSTYYASRVINRGIYLPKWLQRLDNRILYSFRNK